MRTFNGSTEAVRAMTRKLDGNAAAEIMRGGNRAIRKTHNIDTLRSGRKIRSLARQVWIMFLLVACLLAEDLLWDWIFIAIVVLGYVIFELRERKDKRRTRALIINEFSRHWRFSR